MFEAVLDIMDVKGWGVMGRSKKSDGILEAEPFIHWLEYIIFPFGAKDDTPLIIITIGVHDKGFEGMGKREEIRTRVKMEKWSSRER